MPTIQLFQLPSSSARGVPKLIIKKWLNSNLICVIKGKLMGNAKKHPNKGSAKFFDKGGKHAQ